MAVVRTRSIALALAQNPALARDYAEYSLCANRSLGRAIPAMTAAARSAERALPSFGAKEPEGSYKAIEAVIEEVHAGLTQDWARMSDADGFAAFRSLPMEMRDRLMAAAVAETLTPKLPA